MLTPDIRGAIALAGLLLLSGCGKSAAPARSEEAAPQPGIVLTADEMKGLGIATAPVVAAQYSGQATGYGVVTALDAIAQANSDFLTAQATAAQSRAAAARARSLATGEDAAISREAMELAQSKAAADAAALDLARRKTEAAFGLHSPWRNGAERQAMMARLASGEAVLVRVTFPIGVLGKQAPASLRVTRLGNDPKSWSTTTLWDAPADPTVPGRSLYAVVENSDLAQNERVTAAIATGPAQSGVVVPAAALVYGESEAWAYRQAGADRFLRVRIDTARPSGDGYFVSAGLKAGDRVVVSGSGLLLARELNPSTEAGD